VLVVIAYFCYGSSIAGVCFLVMTSGSRKLCYFKEHLFFIYRDVICRNK
jgi:hypothetical protein